MADYFEQQLAQLAENAIQKLRSLGLQACPRCHRHAGWNAEVTGLNITPDPLYGSSSPMPPPYVPCVVVTCKYCAFMAMHSLKGLGLA